MPVVDSLMQSALRSVSSKQSEREMIWMRLQQMFESVQATHLSELFAAEPQRAETFSLQVNSLFLDYSKNFISKDILAELIALAESYDIQNAIHQMMSGVHVNVSENRPALHTALRLPETESLMVNAKNLVTEITETRNKMFDFVEKLQSGAWLGATEQAITDVVNIGIGGSDLGPQMLTQALKPYWNTNLKVHFIANIDPVQFEAVTENLNPETTLFLLSSKSFTTSETLANAQLAKQWLENKLHTKQLAQHFVAITANPARAIAWGIAKEFVLPFWEWVGGRFSIWSSIGFPVALLIGVEGFKRFLQGGHDMDKHFSSAPLAENMPVLLALLGIWYRNFWQAPTHALCSYSYSLRRFADYIQQLDMESNGKSQQPNGDMVAKDTAPIIWGGEGTNAQHAFYQLLHQGRHFIPVDFIVAQNTKAKDKVQHQQLVINCLAQAKALMEGNRALQGADTSINQMQGNKPSNTLMLDALDPYALGQLIALYEHKVFTQGIIWQINSFDQPGVELGKKLADDLTNIVNGKEAKEPIDSSTMLLLKRINTASIN